MEEIKRLETVEREVKDIRFLRRTLQTSLQKHLSIRSSRLVLSHSIMVFHLCFYSFTHNNVETNTEFPNVTVLCCLLSDPIQ